jgi:S1-C subfamily serine protease
MPAKSRESGFAREEHIPSRKVLWLLLALAATLLVTTLAALGAEEERVRPLPPKVPGVWPEYRTQALGLQLRDTTETERKHRSIASGVYVERAIGAAASAGVRAEDIILELDDAPVVDAESFWQAAERAKWAFRLTLKRGDAVLRVSLGGA